MHSLRNTRLCKLNWASGACALLLLCVTAVIPSSAQSFNIIFSFDYTGPVYPGTLVQGTDGNLYGTTGVDGAYDEGTVFKITTNGALTTLYSFCSQTGCADGAAPNGGLVQTADGNFYGTTYEGGALGYGTVFKITPSGTLTTLYSFCSKSGCADGQYPEVGLIQDTNGNFYGTTQVGGVSLFCPYNPVGCGTIFRITPRGKLTTVYNFCSQSGCADGELPAGLIEARNGNLYGTTSQGGLGSNAGTVFEISPSGALTTLYRFCSQKDCPDGKYPVVALVQAGGGNFYGTTYVGGAHGEGTVFKITAAGALTTLYSFCTVRGCWDGKNPSGLIQATDENFYGTTNTGGLRGYGTVFQITPSGDTVNTLYNFCSYRGCRDGANPRTWLIQDTNGNLYGTTSKGGTFHDGELFSLSVGLGPFVETQRTSGKVGAAVKILGTNLTGTTSVAFNGTVAVFKVVSSSLITTTVPTGATTGFVTVTTPSGKLTSNQKFRVIR